MSITIIRGKFRCAKTKLTITAPRQRLLFRLLHSLSLYFPNTGYVQGMASLAATLLCYYDEDMAFVMLVRMWQLRGLDRLYQPGFDGLFEALGDFEKTWLGGRAVADRLVSLEIAKDAYVSLSRLEPPIPLVLPYRAITSINR